MPGLGFGARARAADTKTLRFIAQSDLRVLDPIWTTAYITRNHGYMVFDTLFALDDKFQPHPQMVGDYHISDDKLTYSFTLRDGLKFHDGQPVRGIDCTTSLTRWMARDSLGQTMAGEIAEMKGGDDKSLLDPAEGAVSDADRRDLARYRAWRRSSCPSGSPRPTHSSRSPRWSGSGPFKFVAAEFQPGNKAVYVKNTDYVPRSEPPNWASGGKVVKVDRVEWLVVPDHATAAAALNSGEVDWWENPPLDLVPIFAGHDVTVADGGPMGFPQTLRFNHLWPPFDNVKMRQAVLAVASQADFMTAIAGDPKNWQACPSFFTCGTPMESKAGSEALTGKRDFDKAKKLIAEAGYKGEKIVVLDGTDQTPVHAQALVAADLMKKLGLNVEIAAMDWGQVVTRRASMKPIDQGGWNVFGTGWTGADMLDPTLNQPLRCNGKKAWFGWPTDDKIEALRAAMGQGERPRRPPGHRRANPRARLRGGPLHPGRPVHAENRLPHERQRRAHDPRAPDVERRKDLTVG